MRGFSARGDLVHVVVFNWSTCDAETGISIYTVEKEKRREGIDAE